MGIKQRGIESSDRSGVRADLVEEITAKKKSLRALMSSGYSIRTVSISVNPP